MSRFLIHKVERFDGFQTGRHHDLLLPPGCSALFDEEVEEGQRRKTEEETHRFFKAKESAPEDLPDPGPITLKKNVDHLPLWRRSGPLTSDRPALLHRLYSEECIATARANLQMRGAKDEDALRADEKLLDLLAEVGGTRRLAVPGHGWEAELVKLADDMPNFQAVIRYIRNEIVLANEAKIVPRIAAILLAGPPGVGKTLFAERVAKLFGSGLLRVHMETAQTATELTGSESYWSNSQCGHLFTTLVEGEFANPVVLIDEIDKARGADRYDPTAALYGLLEQNTAAVWHDLSQPKILMDVSPVYWLLTANYQDQIARPLRSRMKIFEIPALTNAQARVAAQRIFKGVVDGLNIKFGAQLPDTMAAVLATTSPREMHQVCRELVGTALNYGRDHVVQTDLNTLDMCPTAVSKWAVAAIQIAISESAGASQPKLH